jgi:hypothetical protein
MPDYLNFVLGSYCDPRDTTAFCTIPFPKLEGKEDDPVKEVCFDEAEALRLVAWIEDCGTMGALYKIDTLTGKANVIKRLGAKEEHAPTTIQHDYLINKYHESLPELFSDEIFVCSDGCGDCQPVEFKFCYSSSHNPKTGETTELTHRAYKTSCCGSKLGIYDESNEDYRAI